MNTQETFTVDEITDVLHEIDIEISRIPDIADEIESVTLNCEFGPITFFCNLHSRSPFFDSVILRAFRVDIQNCLVFANQFNSGFHTSKVVVKVDNSGIPVLDEDGETFVRIENWIHFAGGVTSEHIKYLFELWIEELFDFYEIELDQNESSEEVEVEVPQSPEFLELPLVERIAVYLSLNSDCTARKMSKVLGFDRHEINQVLYKHRDRFSRTKTQPPRWSAIS